MSVNVAPVGDELHRAVVEREPADERRLLERSAHAHLAGGAPVHVRDQARELRNELERQAVGDEVDGHRLRQQAASRHAGEARD